MCRSWLRFPIVDGLYSLHSFPDTKRMFKAMPNIWNAIGNDAKNVWIGNDAPSMAESHTSVDDVANKGF